MDFFIKHSLLEGFLLYNYRVFMITVLVLDLIIKELLPVQQ